LILTFRFCRQPVSASRPGSAKNPTDGLKTAPDALYERFLTVDEAQGLLTALETDKNKLRHAQPLLHLCIMMDQEKTPAVETAGVSEPTPCSDDQGRKSL
jgi:hypothetical protein